jgi:hypothetical protein
MKKKEPVVEKYKNLVQKSQQSQPVCLKKCHFGFRDRKGERNNMHLGCK